MVAAAPYVNAQALLANQQSVQGTLVRGIVPDLEDQVADIGQHMKRGKLTDLQPGQFGIVLGRRARARGRCARWARRWW